MIISDEHRFPGVSAKQLRAPHAAPVPYGTRLQRRARLERARLDRTARALTVLRCGSRFGGIVRAYCAEEFDLHGASF